MSDQCSKGMSSNSKICLPACLSVCPSVCLPQAQYSPCLTPNLFRITNLYMLSIDKLFVNAYTCNTNYALASKQHPVEGTNCACSFKKVFRSLFHRHVGSLIWASGFAQFTINTIFVLIQMRMYST